MIGARLGLTRILRTAGWTRSQNAFGVHLRFSKAIPGCQTARWSITAQIYRYSHNTSGRGFSRKKLFDKPWGRPKLEIPPRPYVLGRTGRVHGDTTSAPRQAACSV